jgi:putative nucleotidyltransferase with HDIG domain
MANTRADAWKLLTEYTESESLRKHALAVEAAMRLYAERAELPADEIELWGNTGLLHDFDYERWPNAPDHPTQGMRILRELGWPEEMIHAIAGHAPYLNVPRDTPLSRTLFAVDELCGFLTACAYVKPTRKISDVETPSVKKKLKDKAFARSVSREDIASGTEELGVPLDDHIDNCKAAMMRVADDLGL